MFLIALTVLVLVALPVLLGAALVLSGVVRLVALAVTAQPTFDRPRPAHAIVRSLPVRPLVERVA